MVGMDHSHLDVIEPLRAAFIHLRSILHTLSRQPVAEFGDSNDFGAVLVRDRDRVADVVAMAMSNKHDVHGLYGFFFFGAGRIAHDPRIYKDRLAFRRFNEKGCVSEPGDFDAVQFHICVSRESNILVWPRGLAQMQLLVCTCKMLLHE